MKVYVRKRLELSPQRRKVLQFLANQERFPSSDEVGRFMGSTTKSAGRDMLNALYGSVYLDRKPKNGKSYSFRVNEAGLEAIR